MGTHTPALQPRWATATLCSPFPHDPSCFGEISLCPLPSSEPDFVLNCHGVTPMVMRQEAGTGENGPCLFNHGRGAYDEHRTKEPRHRHSSLRV